MVSFNRRYRSAQKGYSRVSNKRDVEVQLERELTTRGMPDRFDDRGVAGLVFGDTSRAAPPDRPWPPLDALADLAESQPRLEAPAPEAPAPEAPAPRGLTALWHRAKAWLFSS